MNDFVRIRCKIVSLRISRYPAYPRPTRPSHNERDQYRRTGELRASARKAFEAELASEVRAAIEEVVKILDGRPDGPRG